MTRARFPLSVKDCGCGSRRCNVRFRRWSAPLQSDTNGRIGVTGLHFESVFAPVLPGFLPLTPSTTAQASAPSAAARGTCAAARNATGATNLSAAPPNACTAVQRPIDPCSRDRGAWPSTLPPMSHGSAASTTMRYGTLQDGRRSARRARNIAATSPVNPARATKDPNQPRSQAVAVRQGHGLRAVPGDDRGCIRKRNARHSRSLEIGARRNRI
jgi:hypothetical protein